MVADLRSPVARLTCFGLNERYALRQKNSEPIYLKERQQLNITLVGSEDYNIRISRQFSGTPLVLEVFKKGELQRLFPLEPGVVASVGGDPMNHRVISLPGVYHEQVQISVESDEGIILKDQSNRGITFEIAEKAKNREVPVSDMEKLQKAARALAAQNIIGFAVLLHDEIYQRDFLPGNYVFYVNQFGKICGLGVNGCIAVLNEENKIAGKIPCGQADNLYRLEIGMKEVAGLIGQERNKMCFIETVRIDPRLEVRDRYLTEVLFKSQGYLNDILGNYAMMAYNLSRGGRTDESSALLALEISELIKDKPCRIPA